MNKYPLFISFYTPEYNVQACSLRESLDKFGLDHDIQAVGSLGEWRKNCAMKGAFVRDHLKEASRPIVWVDADAVLLQEPTFFLTKGLEFCTWRKPNGNILSGTVYLAPTKASRLLTRRWAKLCDEKPKTWDQQLLTQAHRTLKDRDRPKWTSLPQGYCKIFDIHWRKGEVHEVVIQHNQASRQLKKVVDKCKKR